MKIKARTITVHIIEGRNHTYATLHSLLHISISTPGNHNFLYFTTEILRICVCKNHLFLRGCVVQWNFKCNNKALTTTTTIAALTTLINQKKNTKKNTRIPKQNNYKKQKKKKG